MVKRHKLNDAPNKMAIDCVNEYCWHKINYKKLDEMTCTKKDEGEDSTKYEMQFYLFYSSLDDFGIQVTKYKLINSQKPSVVDIK